MKYKLICEVSADDFLSLSNLVTRELERGLIPDEVIIQGRKYYAKKVNDTYIICNDVKEIIKEEIKRRKIKLDTVAQDFGFSRQYLFQTLNGTRPLQPELENKICNYLGIE